MGDSMIHTEQDFLLSRQPIHQSGLEVAGYELRAHRDLATTGMAKSEAARAILSTFTDSGLDQIVGEHTGFVHLTSQEFRDGLFEHMPKSRVVLCLSDEPCWDGYGDKISALVRQGYRIALSDPTDNDAFGTLAQHAFAIRIDVTKYLPDELRDRVQALSRFPGKLLADSVDTYDDLEFPKSLGFDYYKGRFLYKPARMAGDLSVSRLTMLRIVSKLQDPELTISDLEQTISQDITLSYKLLLYANSAAVGLASEVASIGHAARMVGAERLRNWASVLLLSAVDNKPRELISVALIRARMCERLAEGKKEAQQESFFSAGLLSVLDALLDLPIEDALSNLPIAAIVKAGIIDRSGTIGQALRCTVAYERADWDEVQFYGLAQGPIRDCYMDAVGWSRQTLGCLTA